MASKIFTDQMNREVSIAFPPKRIISLVPSQTEFLYDLGLDTEIVGQTLFCIHPAQKHKTKTIVGGTKSLKFDVIAQLKPDLIIGNKEENEQGQINELMQHYPVWMSNIYTLTDAYNMMLELGLVVNKSQNAISIVDHIKSQFNDLEVITKKRSVAYFIWNNPYMVAGNNTFINHLLDKLNFENVFVHSNERYPMVTNEDLLAQNPAIIFLSSEPFPFKQKHIDTLKLILPNAKILLVDGEMFSWYGSRLQFSAAYFSNLLKTI